MEMVLVSSWLLWVTIPPKVKMVQSGKEWRCVAQRSWDGAAWCGISVCLHAIVSQVSLAETAVDKVTCTAVPVHPTVLRGVGPAAFTLLPSK